jgi:hypothetical protein
LEEEEWIWRPIMANKCSFESVKSGETSIEDILKINALMQRENDIRGYMESEMHKKAGK